LRFRARGIFQGLDEITLADLYERQRARDFLGIVDASPGRAGRDLRPTAHLWALAEWAELWHGHSPRHLLGWSAVGVAAVLGLAAFVVFLAAKSQRNRRRGASLGLLALASTGLCGMSLQIVSLLVYQVGSGALYRGLSLLLGLFMAGLAVGARLGEAAARRDRHRSVWLCELSTLAVCLGSAWVLPLGATHSWVVLAWSPILGVVTGLAFPVFLAWCRTDAESLEPVAAVTAADHAGAAVGALLTGLILLPLWGVAGTALALSLQKALIGAVMLRRAGT
jgi:hypothetical protein